MAVVVIGIEDDALWADPMYSRGDGVLELIGIID